MQASIKKGTKVINNRENEEYIITDLALYEYEEDDETWYEYEMKDNKGNIYYLSIIEDEDDFFVEISKIIKVWRELPDDDILESSLKVEGIKFVYEDDYEAEITYPWQNNKKEEVEIYEYYNPKNDEDFLTIEIYDDEEDDFEVCLGKIYEISEIEFRK